MYAVRSAHLSDSWASCCVVVFKVTQVEGDTGGHRTDRAKYEATAAMVDFNREPA